MSALPATLGCLHQPVPVLSERPWYEASARRLVAERGAAAAQRVADFHRRSPMFGMETYPDVIEAAIADAAASQMREAV